MDVDKNFKNEWEKIDELIEIVKEKTADMDKPVFLSAIGTVMKLYSFKHNIPMRDFVTEFAVGIFRAENMFSGFGVSDEEDD